MIATITAALAGLRSVTGITDFLLTSSKDIVVREKVVELQSIIIPLQTTVFELQQVISSLQDDNSALHKRIRDLKSMMDEKERWEETAARYKLTSLGAGSHVWAYRPFPEDDTPIHYLCPTCYAERKKSILQKTGYNHLGAMLNCSICKAKIIDQTDQPDTVAYTRIPRRDPFPGYR